MCDLLNFGTVRTDAGIRKVYERAVVSVADHRLDRFAVNRNDRYAVLSGRFGDELFEPGSEVVNFRRSKDRQFVAAVLLTNAENESQECAGIFRRSFNAAGVRHFDRPAEKLFE